MTDETRNLVTRRSALGLMGIGAVGVASETLGFTNVTAGRGVKVGVVGDDEAVLRIVGTGGGGSIDEPLEDPESFDEELQIDFENQSDTEIEGEDGDGDLEVTIDNQEDSEGVIEVTGFGETDIQISVDESDNFQTGLPASETENLTIAMEADDGSDAIINVTVDAVFGGGDFSVNLDREDIHINGVD